MEEYKNPQHRLVFYEAMLIALESKIDRDILFDDAYGLCDVKDRVAVYDPRFKYESEIPAFYELPELWEQKPSEMFSVSWWWYPSDPTPRIAALQKAIELVKEKIN